jgi:hypothetical protein
VGDGHDALFFRDHVAQGQVETGIENFGATHVAVFGADHFQFFADHFHQALGAVEDADQLADLLEDLLVLGQQLLVLQAGQAVQTQFRMAWACSGDRKYLPSRRPYCGSGLRAAGRRRRARP